VNRAHASVHHDSPDQFYYLHSSAAAHIYHSRGAARKEGRKEGRSNKLDGRRAGGRAGRRTFV
jgi:hypothetical protein